MGAMLMSKGFVVQSKLRDYEVLFIDDFVSSLKDQVDDKTIALVDSKLFELNKDSWEASLPSNRYIAIEATEINKTIDYCKIIINKLLEKNIRRDHTLVAIGGGVIQDITAFVSSILFRGINWMFYPTTLLAQGDSCIGGKSSINFGEYKNLLGGFYPPSKIFIDVDFLKTLPPSEIRSGIGEMLHYFLIDKNKAAEDIMERYDEMIENPQQLKEYISVSLQIKKNVIERDEFDKGERNVFNYGHTFGHAIESVSKFAVNHGQAVTMGMDIANFVSLNYGYIDESTFKRIHNILKKNMPDFSLKESDLDAYFKALSKDKKNVGANLGCILMKDKLPISKNIIPLDDKLRQVILSYFNSVS